MVFTILLTMFPIVPSVYATDTLQGGGTKGDPYLISNVAQLEEFRNRVNNGETNICGKLMNDIVLNEDLNSKLNEDGSVSIPKALQPYMGGMTKIEKKHA